MTLEQCIEIIGKSDTKPQKQIILDFKDSGIQVIAGNYGPYIKYDGGNYKIPKDCDASRLTEDECRKIVEEGAPTGKRRWRKGSR